VNSAKDTARRATIKDVAKTADVSIATVSRVVNGNYYVSPEIQQRVRDAIAATGYLPDAIARTMKSNKTHLIGFIVSDIANPHLMTIARSIENVIRDSDYHLLVCSTENDHRLERKYLDAFLSRRISGIILHSTGMIDQYVAQSVSTAIPMMLVYRKNEDQRFVGDVLDTNGYSGACKLAQHLLAKGHRKIGLIGGYIQFSTGRDRYRGYCDALREAGIPLDEQYLYFGDFTEHSGFDGASKLLALSEPPTALLCMNNVVAVGALKFLREKNIRVPEDISLANYGDIENVELMRVQPTRIPQIPAILGRKAGELIMDRIQQPSRPNREIIMDSDIIFGNSVADLRGGS
jgi:DNA-binding LacI/PurR family transcriptional regulator